MQTGHRRTQSWAGIARRPLDGFLGDQSGATAMFFALVLSSLLGMASLAFDASIWFLQKREAQSLADTSAHMASQVLLDGGSIEFAKTQARLLAARNGFQDGVDGTVTVNIPPLNGAYQGDANFAEVIVDRTGKLYFAALLRNDPLSVRSRAVSGRRLLGDNCILALDPTAHAAVDFAGEADITLDCGVFANSDDNHAIEINGNANLTADPASAVGGINIKGEGTLTSNYPPQPNSNPLPDPYVDIEFPATSGCDFTDRVVSGSETLSPGTYCGGLTNSGVATITLDPGVYIFKGGQVNLNSDTTLTGTGVTLMFAASESDSTDIAGITIGGNASVTLTAPDPDGHVSGPYMNQYGGVLFMQDRSIPADNTQVNAFNGGSTMNLSGLVYFPRQRVELMGGAQVDGNCLQIVANTVALKGTSTISNSGGACDVQGVAKISRAYASLKE